MYNLIYAFKTFIDLTLKLIKKLINLTQLKNIINLPILGPRDKINWL